MEPSTCCKHPTFRSSSCEKGVRINGPYLAFKPCGGAPGGA